MNTSGRCIRHVRAPHVCYQLMSLQARSLWRHRAWTSSDSTGFGKRSFRRSCRKEPKLNKCKLLYYQRELPVKYSELRLLNLNCS